MADGKGSILPNNFKTESKPDEKDAENALSAPQTSSDVAAKTHKTAPSSSLSLSSLSSSEAKEEGSRVREGSSATPVGSSDVPSPPGADTLTADKLKANTLGADMLTADKLKAESSVQSVASSPGEGLGADKLNAPKPALERSEGKRGPKTAEGKARSSRNAVKHGIRSPHPFIIEGLESPEEWEEFKLGIIESWQPVGTQELELAINVAWDHWKLRRCRLHENAVLSKQVAETEYELQQADADDDEDHDEDEDNDREDGERPEPAPLPEIDPERLLANQHLKVIPDGWSMDRMLRYEAFVRKALNQDMNMLEVQQARRQGENTPLARVVFNSDPSAAKVRHSAADIPEFQIARQNVRFAELALAERKRAARAERAAHV